MRSNIDTRRGGERYFMSDFITRHRTKISQLFGIAYLMAYIFSNRVLEADMPFVNDIMLIAGSFMIGAAVVGRLWRAQYIAGRKTTSLITEGPYSICRNPLYLFSLIGATGVGLFSGSVTLAAIIPIVFAAIYPVTIKREELDLLAIHGDAYRDYMRSVPRFIPKWRLFCEPPEYQVNTKIFRREMVDSLYFVWIVGLLKAAEVLVEKGIIKTFFTLY